MPDHCAMNPEQLAGRGGPAEMAMTLQMVNYFADPPISVTNPCMLTPIS